MLVMSYGGLKGARYINNIVKTQESSQTMTKHTMSGIQSLNNFSFESGGLRVWRAYDVGPGKRFSSPSVYCERRLVLLDPRL